MPASQKPKVVFLLAIWGESYIRNFFDFSLPSLLAPGNVPAIAQEYDCSFMILTHKAHISFFEKYALLQQLRAYCPVEFFDISDLIFDGNYSATLTLAYERGMRSKGKAMLQTYFFFLVSDYIMADGSLQNTSRYLDEGYSGVTAANFLVVEEYISPLLQEKIEQHPNNILALPAQDLLKLAFHFIHPLTIAHTVTQPFIHASQANQLFWKVNDTVLLGRFYLRHMLCIKPERMDYVIGSFCDYSFIPEMCPSGNVAHIQDSDDYCVIEMAPFKFEQRRIHSGPFDNQELANQLCGWTTSVHRFNAHIPVIYHTENLEAPPEAAIRQSALFIKHIESLLPQQTQPIRGHPYWLSCIDSICHTVIQHPDRSGAQWQRLFAFFIKSPTFSCIWENLLDDFFILRMTHPLQGVLSAKKLWRTSYLKNKLIGLSPQTSPWHLNWYDDFLVKNDVKKILSKNATCIVLAIEPIPEIIRWLEQHYPNQCKYQFYEFFIRRSDAELRKIFHEQKQVLIWLTGNYFCELGQAIRRCKQFLAADCQISVYIKYKELFVNKPFNQNIALCIADLSSAHVICEQIDLHYSISRIYLHRHYRRFAKKLLFPKKALRTRLFGVLGLSILNALSFVGNILSRCGFTFKKKCTSAKILFSTNRKQSKLRP